MLISSLLRRISCTRGSVHVSARHWDKIDIEEKMEDERIYEQMKYIFQLDWFYTLIHSKLLIQQKQEKVLDMSSKGNETLWTRPKINFIALQEKETFYSWDWQFTYCWTISPTLERKSTHYYLQYFLNYTKEFITSVSLMMHLKWNVTM